jgi:hydrogenase maturation protein HypF
VQGVVQGVGFRPFVFDLASSLGLTGFVGNHSGGVFIEVEGTSEALTSFQERLVSAAPPLARIESITAEEIPLRGETSFTIVHSRSGAAANTLISPDLTTCDDCLRELFDPADRRYRYPFINCTNCGPRFTLIRDIPYDRPLTTMAGFVMCPACQAEYDDPRNRRFHAQPNACPVCGPQLEFCWSEEANPFAFQLAAERNAIRCAQAVIAQGGIVAVKGLGGFHLACDAASDTALRMLRQRKGRVDKPFAIMAPDLNTVTRFAEISTEEAALLTSRERPIVLLKKRPGCVVSDLVAPGNPYLGVMLPYTPLHYLILAPDSIAQPPSNNKRQSPHAEEEPENHSSFVIHHSPFSILVMTSGNYSDEPIAKDNEEALDRLSPLADAFLLHNRGIQAHCDDSVIRVFEGQELPLRRSRGYAPFPVKLPFEVPPLLAVGGELKATFCLTKGRYAYMSQHIGDMENLETLQAFEKAVAHFQALFRIRPQAIAADLHPGYLSSRWAREQQLTISNEQTANNSEFRIQNLESSTPPPFHFIQHHHAHIAAVMAEHGLDGAEPVIGFSFDGTGYGSDGAIWGGEVLLVDYKRFERLAHLKYVPLPGGDAAIKRPYRTALAHLWAAGIDWDDVLLPVAACLATECGIIRRQLERRLNIVPTSSMGRLFDAVAALAGVRQTVTYEGQAAIEFEALAADDVQAGYAFDFSTNEIDSTPVIRAVVDDVRAGVSPALISAKFHHGVADLIVSLSLNWRERLGLNVVALSGGVFQNVTLLRAAAQRLRAERFKLLTHRLVPPNDGGLALGQAIICSQRMA